MIVVLVQNHGFHSIGSLSESLGSQRFGTKYRYRDSESGRLEGDCCRSTSRPTPAASVPTSSRCTPRASSSRPSRTPRRRPPTAARSSSTSRRTHGLRPGRRRLVGRARQRRLGARLDAGRLRRLPGAQEAQRPLIAPTRPSKTPLRGPNDDQARHARQRPRQLGGVVRGRPGQQTPWRRFLDEVAQAGYTRIELGPYGYLPTDPSHLREELDNRGLTVTAGTIFEHLHRKDSWDSHVVGRLGRRRAHGGDGGRAPRRHPGLLARPGDRRHHRGRPADRPGVAGLRHPDQPAGQGDP